MISQASYVGKLLERAGMADCKSAHTPMEAHYQLSNDSEGTPVDATFYRSIIGCSSYILHTPLDITFAVGFLR